MHNQVVTGPAFWQSAEIEDAPALLTDTLRAMTALPADPLSAAPSNQATQPTTAAAP